MTHTKLCIAAWMSASSIMGAACTFTSRGADDASTLTPGDAGDPTSADGPPPDGLPVDGSPDAAPAYLTCPADANLEACLSFDGFAAGALQGNFTDEAATPNQLTIEGGVQVGAGPAGHAIWVNGNATIWLRGGPARAATAASFDLWVRVDGQLPNGNGRMGVVDNDARFALFYAARGSQRVWRCSAGGAIETAAVSGSWQHIACMCADGQLSMFINGTAVPVANPVSCPGMEMGGDLVLAGNETGGGNVNERLVGGVDSLRVWSRTLTSAQICAAAGRNDCAL